MTNGEWKHWRRQLEQEKDSREGSLSCHGLGIENNIERSSYLNYWLSILPSRFIE